MEERGNTEGKRNTDGTTGGEALGTTTVLPTHHRMILMYQSLSSRKVGNTDMLGTGRKIEDIDQAETAKEGQDDDQSTKED